MLKVCDVHIDTTKGVFLNVVLFCFQRNDKYILWEHIRDLHEKLRGMAVQSGGLSLAPKLKLEHINLTSYSRMRVDLAAQVT